MLYAVTHLDLLNGSKVAPVSPCQYIWPGLLSLQLSSPPLDGQTLLGGVSGSALFSEAVSLSAEPGLTLLPTVLTGEETNGVNCTPAITRDDAIFRELCRTKPHHLRP